jgi:hypothetical protein
MPRISEPLMVIHNGGPGERISSDYHEAAHDPETEWVVPDAGHIAAATTHRRE